MLKHNEFVKEHKAEREKAQNWIHREKALTNNVLNLQNLMVSIVWDGGIRLLAKHCRTVILSFSFLSMELA